MPESQPRTGPASHEGKPLCVLCVSVDNSWTQRLSRDFEHAGRPGVLLHCQDAQSALATALSRQVDVVVVEPRIMGGSGNALLSLFKRDHSQVIRVLLLDDGRDSPALAALENLHRLFYQPLQARELISAVDGIKELRAKLRSPLLAAAISRVGKLPAPPSLAIELMRRTEDPKVGAAEISRMIERDPALAAKVLRLCNSAMYSGGRSIRDIHTAVVWLGNLTLRRLVLAGEVFGGPKARTHDPERDMLRKRSLHAARLAARILPGFQADLAGTAALLSGVGLLLPNAVAPWHSKQPSSDISGDLNYAEAGAYLLELWGLPGILVEAAAYHPTPAKVNDGEFGVIGAVHVAWALLSDMPLDELYLAELGLLDQLERWKVIAQEVVAEPD